MKKVLVIGMKTNPGGMESVIMNYYRNVDRSKISFDFACVGKGIAYGEELKQAGSKIFTLPVRRKHPFKYYSMVKQIFRENTYDAIWCNYTILNNICHLKFAKKYGVKIRIVHSHSSKFMHRRLRFMFFHFLHKHFIDKYATHFWSCDMLASKFFYPKRVIKSPMHKIIDNAVNIDKYKFDEEIRNRYRKELNVENDFVVGNVGRLRFEKNQSFLIKIFKKITELKPNVKLLLVGQGEDEQKLKNLASSLEIDEKVLFLGARADVNSLLNAIDVMAFPSLFEGRSVALIEAQVNGVPIVASDTISELSKVNDNFYFKSLNDSDSDWAKVIIEKGESQENSRISYYDKFKGTNYDIKYVIKQFEQTICQGENN